MATGLLGATPEYKDYNGKQVFTGQSMMDSITSGTDSYNKALGKSLSPQEYDQMVNPTTYGARWGIDASQMAAPTAVTPAAPKGLLSASSLDPSMVAGYDPMKATSGAATTTNAAAVKAIANGYAANTIAPSPESSAAYQLGRITSEDSPLNTQARTTADALSNRRGLLNSSIAVGSAQDAVLKNAMPLAQQDAATHANAETFNATAKNTADQFGAAAGNTKELTNAQLGTNVSLSNATEANKTSQFNTNLDANTSQYNATSANQAGAFRADAANAAATQARENATRSAIAQIQASTTMNVAEKQITSQQLQSAADNAAKFGLAQLSADTQMKIANMDITSKTALAKISTDSDQLIRSNASAAALMQQAMVGLAQISSSTMDQAAKDAAANNMIVQLQNSMDAIGSISSMNLSQYFPTVTPTTTPTFQTGGLLGANGGDFTG